MYDTLVTQPPATDWLRITLNRPELHNAFNDAAGRDLTACAGSRRARRRHRRRCCSPAPARASAPAPTPAGCAAWPRPAKLENTRGLAAPGAHAPAAELPVQADPRPRATARPTAAASAWWPAATSPSASRARNSPCPRSSWAWCRRPSRPTWSRPSACATRAACSSPARCSTPAARPHSACCTNACPTTDSTTPSSSVLRRPAPRRPAGAARGQAPGAARGRHGRARGGAGSTRATPN